MKRIDSQTVLLFVIALLLVPGAWNTFEDVRSNGAHRRTAEKLADYGDKSIQQGAFERAVIALQRAVEIAPTDGDLRRRLVIAQARLTAERPSALTKEGALGLEMDIEMAGVDLSGSAAVGVAYAQVELLLGRVGDAHARLDTLSGLFPESALVQHGVGKSRMLRGTTDLAIDPLSKAVALDPKNPRYRRSLGLALARAKQWARAEEELSRAIEQAPEGLLQWRLGEARLELKRYDGAVEALRRAVNSMPRDQRQSLARAQLGFALHKLGRNYEAIRELRLAHEQLPTPAILHNLGIAHQAVGNHRKAVELFRRALAGDPLNGDGHVRLIQSLLAAGQKPMAERALARIESLARTHEALKAAERAARALLEKG